VIRVSKAGSLRSPVIIIGKFAFKFARNMRGRASNIYEARLYRSVNDTRRALLCPVLWVSKGGAVQIMRAAEPLTDMMTMEEYIEVVEAWEYIPGEDGCPFEPKASDWGWFEGRRVALDYSTPAWETNGEIDAGTILTRHTVAPRDEPLQPLRQVPRVSLKPPHVGWGQIAVAIENGHHGLLKRATRTCWCYCRSTAVVSSLRVC
jgi:hypothetical protein